MERRDDWSALVLADRLACLGTLVAGVAHELNNPITYVLGNLVELERLTTSMREVVDAYRSETEAHPGGSDRAREIEAKLEQLGGVGALDEVLGDALEGAERVRDLVRDVLALCHPSDPVREGVDPHEVLDSSLRLVSRRLGPVARLERNYTATREAAADRTRLGQVVVNLLTNAIDACTSSPSREHVITVRTQDASSGGQQSLAIEIEDTGAGIPEELRQKVFEPFFTTKHVGEGTGLGLHISRRIVESFGGQLDFRSGPPGTTFRVALPVRGTTDRGQQAGQAEGAAAEAGPDERA